MKEIKIDDLPVLEELDDEKLKGVFGGYAKTLSTSTSTSKDTKGLISDSESEKSPDLADEDVLDDPLAKPTATKTTLTSTATKKSYY